MRQEMSGKSWCRSQQRV